jgi:hypothetical protein
MFFLSLLFIPFCLAQNETLGFGLLITTDYEARTYFDRHLHQLRDDGNHPDEKARDKIYTLFVPAQTTLATPLSIIKGTEEIFSTTLPPISNTERYVLTIRSTKTTLERVSLETSLDNNDHRITTESIMLALISLSLGILIGFYIKKKRPQIKGIRIPSTKIPSQTFSYTKKSEILQKLLAFSQQKYLVFVGTSPSEWTEFAVFGRWFFVEEDELSDIKQYVQQTDIGDSSIFVYTKPESIVEVDCQSPQTQKSNIQTFLQQHPHNVLVFLPTQESNI